MDTARDIAHAILETAEQVYETTGWCKNVLVNRDGERCLNGALVVGIITQCHTWGEWASSLSSMMYPDFYAAVNCSDMEKAAILLATANLAKAAKQVADEIGVPIKAYPYTSIMHNAAVLTGLNDDPITTHEDILLAIGKARADT